MVSLLLMCGALGKSAQFPLYVWLPDAMAGPTPVSALIHAATMVTAGVYMVCRMSALYTAAPEAMAVVAGVGALTALFAATMGMAATDIKKVLAYSTVSQLGYMFVGMGVGAYAAGMFHLVTHAFFKACLFLCAGSVIHAVHSQEMPDMGGLEVQRELGRRGCRIPVVFLSGHGDIPIAVEAIREVGVTRLSLGVENFDAHILEVNARAHRIREIHRAYEFAREIACGCGADPQRIRPCGSDAFPTAAARPACSVLRSRRLEAAGCTPRPTWRDALARSAAAAGSVSVRSVSDAPWSGSTCSVCAVACRGLTNRAMTVRTIAQRRPRAMGIAGDARRGDGCAENT